MTRRRDKRLGARLRRHPAAFGAVLAVLIAAVTVLAAVSTNGVPVLASYEVVATLPPGTPALRAGSDVRVNGQLSGRVTAVSRAPGGGQRVRLTVRDSPIGRDAHLTVRLRAPAGQRYIALERGDYRRRPLADGGTLAAPDAHATDDLATVVEGFDRRTLEDSRRAIRLAGVGVAGQGTTLNRSVRDLDQTLAHTTGVLRAVAPGTELATLVRQGGTLARSLQGRESGDAGRLTTGAARLFAVLADPRSRLDQTLRELPATEQQTLAALPEIDPLLESTTALAVRAGPLVGELDSALPEVNTLLDEGASLRTEVAALAPPAAGALRPLRPVLRQTGPSAVLLDRTLRPLGPFSTRLSRYDRLLESGLTGYYVASLYHPQVGGGAGFPIAPAMVVLTCASGSNPDPQPDDFFEDRLDRPCR